MSQRIADVMTKDNLITGLVGTTLDEAKNILRKNKIEKLPLVDNEKHLKGLITIKDIEKVMKYPNSAKDSSGRLLYAETDRLDMFIIIQCRSLSGSSADNDCVRVILDLILNQVRECFIIDFSVFLLQLPRQPVH